MLFHYRIFPYFAFFYMFHFMFFLMFCHLIFFCYSFYFFSFCSFFHVFPFSLGFLYSLFQFLFFSFKHVSLHQYQSLTVDVSSVIGAPWRCGVLTTWSGVAGIGYGHLLGREHDSTPQSGVEAPLLIKRSLSSLYYCGCCRCGGFRQMCSLCRQSARILKNRTPLPDIQCFLRSHLQSKAPSRLQYSRRTPGAERTSNSAVPQPNQ